MNKPIYLNFLTNTGQIVKTDEGQNLPVWELSVPDDEACLTDWAFRFRQNYCRDSDIDILRDGTGMSKSEYLINLIFPDENTAPGPSIRSGDFAELISPRRHVLQ